MCVLKVIPRYERVSPTAVWDMHARSRITSHIQYVYFWYVLVYALRDGEVDATTSRRKGYWNKSHRQSISPESAFIGSMRIYRDSDVSQIKVFQLPSTRQTNIPPSVESLKPSYCESSEQHVHNIHHPSPPPPIIIVRRFLPIDTKRSAHKSAV